MERFDFEKLVVWQETVSFGVKVIQLIDTLQTDRKHFRLIEQLESATASVSQNIAEGKGRYSKKEFLQFLYYSRGSLYEVISLLTIFHKLGWINNEQLDTLKSDALILAKRLNAFINAIKKSI